MAKKFTRSPKTLSQQCSELGFNIARLVQYTPRDESLM